LGSGQRPARCSSPAQGTGLIPVPQVVSGVTETLFQPLEVPDLFPQAQVSTNSLGYIVEGTATSGAAGVAEGGAKPASDLALSTLDEPVKKIATSLITSDELLEDASSVQAYLNGRLSLFVKIEEERQLLRGGGTNELVGLVGRSGVNVYSRGTVDNNAVAIAKVIANTRGSSFLEPTGIVMHPSNWLATRLLQDSQNQFYGGGPFSGAYGNAGATGLFGQTLWNVPVVLSTTVGAGTAIVGSFAQGATVYRRGGLTVEATNSRASLFLTNEVAIRAEERLALAVWRPGAFTVVSGLS
jgi:HK97 family phage major capsid protein